MDWEEHFDGIWASASLLHVPRSELPQVAEKFRRALKPHGVSYVSFKHGAQDHSTHDRHFMNFTESGLRAELGSVPGLEIVESWTSHDVRPERAGDLWTNALLRKLPGAI